MSSIDQGGGKRRLGTLFEYLVAILIKANRRHKKEPQAQYATGLGLGSLLPQLRLLSWAALSVGDGCRPARPNADYLVSARGQSNARNEADRVVRSRNNL